MSDKAIEIPDYVTEWLQTNSYSEFVDNQGFITYTDGYVEINLREINDVLMMKCRNIEVFEYLIFIVCVPLKKDDFLTLMNILLPEE